MIIEAAKSTTLTSLTDHSTVLPPALSSVSNEITLIASLPACSPKDSHELDDLEIVETTRCLRPHTSDDIQLNNPVSSSSFTLPSPVNDLAVQSPPNQSPPTTCNASPSILETSSRIAGSTCASRSGESKRASTNIRPLPTLDLATPRRFADLSTEPLTLSEPLLTVSSSDLDSERTSRERAAAPSPSSLSAEYRTEHNLEECIISSSVEDHHYCSAVSNTSEEPSISCPTIAPSAATPISKTTKRSKSTKPAASKTSSGKKKLKPSTSSSSNCGKSTVTSNKSTSTRVTKAKAKAKTNVATANWSASLQIGNDCFKRFYLQRQVDGTFVIVPVGEPTTTTTSCNSSSSGKSSFAPNPLKAAVPLTSGVPGCGQLVLLHEQSLKLQPVELMRIDKASLALDPAVSTHFSLADSSGSGQGKSTAETMSAQVNKSTPAFGSAMRSNGNNLHYQQSQSRAILSALKHDHLTSTAPVNQLTSPPPVVSSSSSSPVSQKLTMEEADTYPSSFGPNGSLANSFLMSGNLLDQNMLVAALPPVETIFATERSSLANGPSLANLQQSEDNDLGMGHNFTSTTIIHDQHIDYYSHAVDSTVDDDDELLSNSKCLPFGYFYHDDDKVFDQLQLISSSLPSSTTSSPVLDGLNPLTDLFGSSAVKSEANGGFNSEEYDFANEMAFEFDNSGMQASSRARISPMAQTSAQSLMNCDSDPLISGNDVGNLNINSTKNAAFIQSMSLPSSGSTSAGMLHSAGKTLASNSFSSVNQLNSDSIFDSNQMLAEGNGDSFLIENGHSYSCSKQKGSPMINRDTPTLAQLNLQLPIKEEEEEMINWPNGLQNNGFAHTLPCNGMDLNGQQQNNIISSTSSPTVKSSPLVDTNDNKFWFSQNNVPNESGSLGNVSTGSANNVTSSLEELMVPEMDDGSLEIEAILQHSQAPLSSSFSGSSGLYSGSQHNLVSPPKLSSSLPMSSFKSPLVQKQKIKRPNFVLPQRNGDKGTLLSELLLSNNSNVNDILRTNGSMVINVNNSQLNLVQKQPNQMSALNGSSQNAFPNYSPKGSRGKSMFNYPTLTALITSPNLNINNSPMLSSAALLPPISNLTSGPSMATILANNNRNRNNSMSTDYSVSSHDEGFASQPEEESESDDNSEEMMLMADTNEDLIDDMFFIETAVTPNDNSATVDCQQQQMSQQDLLTHSDASLVNAMANAVTQSELDLLGPVKQEEEPMWCPATQPLPTVNQQSIKSEGQYQPSKASTSSAIDDNESADEDEEDDDDESFYGDYDASDLLGATTSDDVNNKWSLNMGRSRKGSEKRFFWQYNVQSKGPKGPRFNGAANSSFEEEEDPHVFNEISDPVFAPDCQVEGVKHSGKARRGDGNDLTPNPKKLLMIGLELKKLSRTINDLTPVTEVPFTCRNKSRKEKNKLASRACRLKKKAQHEANKIKLHGLHREHAKMVKAISEMRKVVELGRKMVDNGNKPVYVPLDGVTYQLASVANLDSLMEEVHGRHKAQMEIAGRTADFVNHILDNVSSGIANGGIECV